MVPEILDRIRAPTFRNEDFLITSYNAVAGGEVDNTEAFRQAIAACNGGGGGRVVVPAVSVTSSYPMQRFHNKCFSRVHF